MAGAGPTSPALSLIRILDVPPWLFDARPDEAGLGNDHGPVIPAESFFGQRHGFDRAARLPAEEGFRGLPVQIGKEDDLLFRDDPGEAVSFVAAEGEFLPDTGLDLCRGRRIAHPLGENPIAQAVAAFRQEDDDAAFTGGPTEIGRAHV